MVLNDMQNMSLTELLKKCDITKCNIITNTETGTIAKFILEYTPIDDPHMPKMPIF